MSQLITEERNPASTDIDKLATLQICQLMNREDAQIARAVAKELPHVAAAVDRIVERLQRGGRLIYVGAGTSGRLGMLDAAECPATFGTPPMLVQALIAGGEAALRGPVAGAEDSEEAGHVDLALLAVTALDAVVGLSAAGNTLYVLGALAEAATREALTVAVTCNPNTPLEALAEIAIVPIVGPEVIAGCTRLKAATAQKMVLDMISTATMVRLGKTLGNLMVDLQPALSAELRQRAVHIVAEAAQVPEAKAERLLDAANGEARTAIVAHQAGISPEEARQRGA